MASEVPAGVVCLCVGDVVLWTVTAIVLVLDLTDLADPHEVPPKVSGAEVWRRLADVVTVWVCPLVCDRVVSEVSWSVESGTVGCEWAPLDSVVCVVVPRVVDDGGSFLAYGAPPVGGD